MVALAAIGQTVINGVATPIEWVGTGLSFGGKVVTYTAAGVGVGVGYPVAVASFIVAVSCGVFATGPCIAYDNLPNMRTPPGLSQMIFSPERTTNQIIEAAYCPYALHSFVTSATISLVSYLVARCARRVFAA